MKDHQRTKNLVLAAMLVAILVILGLLPGIPLGIIPVPLVLQNMGVMLAGGLLGSKYGTAAVGLFLLLVFLGLPLLSGGRGGATVFLGPSGGYLIAWLFVPFLIGRLKRLFQVRAQHSWWHELLIVGVAGVIFVDVVGALWLAWQSSIPLSTALVSNLVFIPGDLLKAILAVVITRRIRNLMQLEVEY
ncbi:biotin transporter BioY [Liquorilactobacillus satsumensis]|uniref:Biotin transporter n=1 Tax=Liquorilactobacillus satsumensis DSM 16230 = JCM 12392 TaxID=1423801 RepID=A0A0R1UZF7_9LACO|nr:biotin transporter BioY [Liquorilactobacillus satsumensis]KRL98721.1 bioY protein [Liquorilactobacillus satsumensis DSM 16230 = JCM 12392]